MATTIEIPPELLVALDEWMQREVRNAVEHPVMVLTGGEHDGQV